MLQLLRKAASAKADNGNGKPRREGKGAQQDAPARRRRVLLVEDNLDTVRSMALLLRDMGHEVEYSINAYVAIEIARRFRPEIVFLDLGLPGMDGFELCRRLKRDPDLAASTVIAITGYAQEDYRTRSREAGCAEHFVKPIDPQV